MELFARVNVLGGRAVRLDRGDIRLAVSLDASPVERAQGWVAKGVDQLLIVDLDAAAHNDNKNRGLVADMVAAVDIPVLVGGGVRTPTEARRLLDSGVDQVVMGTAAIENQLMVYELCRDYPEKIVVSLDVHPNEELATRGWTAQSGRFLEEVILEMASAGAAGFMLAEVGRDTLVDPPHFEALMTALEMVDEPVIASGGARHVGDLSALAALEYQGHKLSGVVVGREVTEGRFTVAEAIAALS
jgi:phosphoribosylformimino-5-aminoimidazole carboxamide ribotide isomerase